MSHLDAEIDALYQLPLKEFTAARATLAKRLAKDDAATVRQLRKPTVVPWVVNQIYWKSRPTYAHLLRTGQALRSVQIQALKGKRSDVRGAAEAHRGALAAAVRAAVTFAAVAGVKVNPEPLARMLEAVSLMPHHPERPGRLIDMAAPAGFDALAGVKPAKLRLAPVAASPSQETPAARQAIDPQSLVRQAAEDARLRQRAAADVQTATRVAARARARADKARAVLEKHERDVETAVRALSAARLRLSGMTSPAALDDRGGTR